MAKKSKKNVAETGGITESGFQTLRIGSRVRCTDDGMTGRITWANGVAVKIKWDDGEQVTWKRDSLGEKPIEILDADEQPEETPPAAAQPAPAAEQAEATETTPATDSRTEPTIAETTQPGVEGAAAGADAVVPGAVALDPVPGDLPAADRAPAFYLPSPEPGAEATAPAPADAEAGAVPSPRRRQPKTPAAPKEKKPSALDAAAKVLAEAGKPMTCKEMIGAMAIKGYWTSPGGKTPDATLYSALLREITTKGEQARFVKAGPGHFTLRPTA